MKSKDNIMGKGHSSLEEPCEDGMTLMWRPSELHSEDVTKVWRAQPAGNGCRVRKRRTIGGLTEVGPHVYTGQGIKQDFGNVGLSSKWALPTDGTWQSFAQRRRLTFWAG